MLAEIDGANGNCVASNGDIYIADTTNEIIRKISASTGIITTVAGTQGVSGYTGDGATATSATLHTPYAVDIDSLGNLFICDSGNNCVRKVDSSTGFISTVAGTGTAGNTGNGGLATLAKLKSPYAAHPAPNGDLYIADKGNNEVRVVNHSTGFISIFAGTGTASSTGNGGPATSATLNSPYDVAIDPAGDVYIAEYQGNYVRKVDASTGFISIFAGNGTAGYTDGPALSASINGPYTMILAPTGELYLVDYYSYIREVAGGQVTTVAGNGTVNYAGDYSPATATGMYPGALNLDPSGAFVWADYQCDRVIRLAPCASLPTATASFTVSQTQTRTPTRTATSTRTPTPLQTATPSATKTWTSTPPSSSTTTPGAGTATATPPAPSQTTTASPSGTPQPCGALYINSALVGSSGVDLNAPFTIQDGQSRLLLVSISVNSGTDSITSVAYNGVPLGAPVASVFQNATHIWVYATTNLPGAGSYNLQVVHPAGAVISVWAAAFAGIRQTAPIGAVSLYNAGSSENTFSQAINTQNDYSLLVSVVADQGTAIGLPTPKAGQTGLYGDNTAFSNGASYSQAGLVGAYNLGYNYSNFDFPEGIVVELVRELCAGETPTFTPTVTPSASPSPSFTASPSPSPTASPSPTVSPTFTPSPVVSATQTSSASPTPVPNGIVYGNDAASLAANPSGSAVSMAFTPAAGANQLMVILVDGESGYFSSTVTFNGATATLQRFDANGANNFQAVYTLLAPAPGNHTLVVSPSVGQFNPIRVTAFTYLNVNQSTPTGAQNGGILTASNPPYNLNVTVTAASSSGTLLEMSDIQACAGTYTLAAPGTLRYDLPYTLNSPHTLAFADFANTSAGTVGTAFSWTGPPCSSPMVCQVLELLPAVVVPTSTPTVAGSSTSTITNTYTASPTPTFTISNTYTVSPTPTFTITNTYSVSPTPTFTITNTYSVSPTPTFTLTNTYSVSPTPTFTITNTYSVSPTPTFTITNTYSVSPTPTFTITKTYTASPSPTFTITNTHTDSPTQTSTNSPTFTTSPTSTFTITNTYSVSPTPTFTITKTFTASPSTTFTVTNTVTDSPTQSSTVTDTCTASPSSTFTITKTLTPTLTASMSPTESGTPPNTPTSSPTFTQSSTKSATITRTFTSSPTETYTVSPTRTATETDTPRPSATSSHTATETFTPRPSATPPPTKTPLPTATPVYTAKPSPTASISAVLDRNIFRPALGQPLGIAFLPPQNGFVTIHIFDMFGGKVGTPFEASVSTGLWIQTHWNGTNGQGQSVANGVYFISIQGAGIHTVKKVVLIR